MTKFIHKLHSLFLPFWVALNVLIAGITVFAGYGSHIDQEFMPFAGIAQLTFPAWYILCVVLLVVDLIICRWSTLAPGLALVIALKAWLIFSPMHFGGGELSEEEASRSFNILSYNVVSFRDEEPEKSTPEFNRTMHTILSSGADAVALLEYENQGRITKFVPQSQIDSLYRIYPYFSRGGLGTVLFSKRPILHITPPENIHSKGSIEAFRTQVGGKPLNIFAVHLESIGLDDRDKELYRELTDKDSDVSVRSVRSQIIGKLASAFVKRSEQARMLRSYVEQLGGDAVVCGDFNDVPGCRTVKILKEAGMKDAYAETATGPCVTFNSPSFAFRIDHVLWRGDFEAKKIERGNVPSSDHYPMLTTFVWDADVQRGTND